jgi:predicted outer membrane lipoprotein
MTLDCTTVRLIGKEALFLNAGDARCRAWRRAGFAGMLLAVSFAILTALRLPETCTMPDMDSTDSTVAELKAAIAKGDGGHARAWVFCFEQPIRVRGRVYHQAGATLFGPGDHGLHTMLRANLDEACKQAGVPRLLFHDLRRSAARNFERAGVPRSVARLIGGWGDRIYSRYAIGAESELESALSQVGDYLDQRGWHSGGTRQ